MPRTPPAVLARPKPRLGPVLQVCATVVVALSSGFFRQRWRHLERIPAAGPAIVVANHVSYADPFVVARAIWVSRRIPRFLAKQSLFDLPVAGWALRRTGQIPVERSTSSAAQSLGAAVAALRRGELVVIYPEGTVTRDAQFWPMTGRTGVARLIAQLPDVPVIPVGQWGAQHAVDVYHRRFRLVPRATVTVSVGSALDVSAHLADLGTPAGVRRLTDVVMDAVREQVAGIRGLPVPPAPGKRA